MNEWMNEWMNECNRQGFQHLSLTNEITSWWHLIDTTRLHSTEVGMCAFSLTFGNDDGRCFVSLYWCIFLVFSYVLLPESWASYPKNSYNFHRGGGGCRFPARTPMPSDAVNCNVYRYWRPSDFSVGQQRSHNRYRNNPVCRGSEEKKWLEKQHQLSLE